MSGSAILMSIRPGYAEAIFSGSKTIELRRRRPAIGPNDLVLVYVTLPTGTLSGAFLVKAVHEDTPASLWQRFEREAKIAKPDFDRYFAGVDKAYGIEIDRAWQLEKPKTLARLKKHRILPPQSFRYLDTKTVKILTE